MLHHGTEVSFSSNYGQKALIQAVAPKSHKTVVTINLQIFYPDKVLHAGK
jgi:hypothetical protein